MKISSLFVSKRIFIIVSLIIINVILSCWYLINGDFHFFTDIARDFLILREIDIKKIILIGPRSSIEGVFHGPLWAYLNYPFYVLGNGNPLVVNLLWVFLVVLFLITTYFIVKDLFSKKTALLSVLMLSVHFIFHTWELFHPHGALFLTPIFYWSSVKFWTTNRTKFLIILLLSSGFMIQFQMAIGLPFLILGSLLAFVNIVRSQKYIQLLSFFIVLIPLSTFIFFEIKHDFYQTRAVIKYFNEKPEYSDNFSKRISDRFQMLSSTSIQLVKNDPTGYENRAVFYLIFITLIVLLRKKHFKTQYLIGVYLYLGFFFISVFKKGVILYPHQFALLPLVVIVFSSFISRKNSIILTLAYCIIYSLNFYSAQNFIINSANFIGKDESSWKFQNKMTEDILKDTKDNFGYFIYSPDLFGYSTKYAMYYAVSKYKRNALSFQKAPLTYIISAPPPKDIPYLNSSGWKKVQVKITSDPIKTFNYPNGYIVEKFQLEKNEVNIPSADYLDVGLNFR